MDILFFILAIVTFVILSPGVFIRLPKKGSKFTVVTVHGLIFITVLYFIDYIMKNVKNVEGMPGGLGSSAVDSSTLIMPDTNTTPPVYYTTGPSVDYITGPPDYITGSPNYTMGPSVDYTTGPSVDYTMGPSVDYTTGPSVDYTMGPSVDYTTGPSVDYTTEPPYYTTEPPYYTTEPPYYTTGPTQSPTQRSANLPVEKVGNYEYQGCYKDNRKRAIPYYKGKVNSIQQCADIATKILTANNKYSGVVFGVQYGGQCFTGKSKDQAKKYGAVADINSCKRNGQLLGGGWNNLVYELNGPLPTPLKPTEPPQPQPAQKVGDYVFKGCYNDYVKNRAIPKFHKGTKTLQHCANKAAEGLKHGTGTVFGVQYGGQCFTGNSLDDAEKYGPVTNLHNCNTKGKLLGGSTTNLVYQFQGTLPPRYIPPKKKGRGK